MNKIIKVYEIGENIKEILVDDERSGNAIKILDTLEEKSKNLIIRHKFINSETHFLINFEKFSDEDFNNIANTRYYRWEKYPSQRFNLMAGLTFIPF